MNSARSRRDATRSGATRELLQIIDQGTQTTTRTCPPGTLRRINALIDAGADIHAASVVAGATSFPDAPLRGAARNGWLPVVTRLLDRGADIHAGGDMPLLNAIINGNDAVVRVLLERGADVHAVVDDAPEGPLRDACDYECARVVRTLLGHGADATQVDDRDGADLIRRAIRAMVRSPDATERQAGIDQLTRLMLMSDGDDRAVWAASQLARLAEAS